MIANVGTLQHLSHLVLQLGLLLAADLPRGGDGHGGKSVGGAHTQEREEGPERGARDLDQGDGVATGILDLRAELPIMPPYREVRPIRLQPGRLDLLPLGFGQGGEWEDPCKLDKRRWNTLGDESIKNHVLQFLPTVRRQRPVDGDGNSRMGIVGSDLLELSIDVVVVAEVCGLVTDNFTVVYCFLNSFLKISERNFSNPACYSHHHVVPDIFDLIRLGGGEGEGVGAHGERMGVLYCSVMVLFGLRMEMSVKVLMRVDSSSKY
ncbi:hypothetical protein PG996_004231 [Apiospora saccharicola]|uniref:Secreted protein n=1 Tax=Apiospora saccharicola TaxID=335842 RepID=A0ABR1W3H6_9PEZI